MKRVLSLFAVFSLLLVGAGCQSIMHELQPHRLWRMNYSDTPGRSAGAYFSLSDDLTQPISGYPGGLMSEQLSESSEE